MTGETNLSKLIKGMTPILNDGQYVFCTIKSWKSIDISSVLFHFNEAEGITIVLKKEIADQHEIPYEYIASWITLQVHSSLEAVGLTAAFANALADVNLSCNVVAGYYHDHIFVDHKVADLTIETLKDLARNA